MDRLVGAGRLYVGIRALASSGLDQETEEPVFEVLWTLFGHLEGQIFAVAGSMFLDQNKDMTREYDSY